MFPVEKTQAVMPGGITLNDLLPTLLHFCNNKTPYTGQWVNIFARSLNARETSAGTTSKKQLTASDLKKRRTLPVSVSHDWD
jgi:hypothetical protein